MYRVSHECSSTGGAGSAAFGVVAEITPSIKAEEVVTSAIVVLSEREMDVERERKLYLVLLPYTFPSNCIPHDGCFFLRLDYI